MRTKKEIEETIKKIESLAVKDCGNDPFYPCCVKEAVTLALKWVLGENVDLVKYVLDSCV